MINSGVKSKTKLGDFSDRGEVPGILVSTFFATRRRTDYFPITRWGRKVARGGNTIVRTRARIARPMKGITAR